MEQSADCVVFNGRWRRLRFKESHDRERLGNLFEVPQPWSGGILERRQQLETRGLKKTHLDLGRTWKNQ